MSIEAEWRDATEIAAWHRMPDAAVVTMQTRLATLGRNLAIAGALLAAESRGFWRGVQAAALLDVVGLPP